MDRSGDGPVAGARLLEVEGLSVRFETLSRVVQAVDDMSFAVDRGETLAIVGESGCGKSVTALAILRLLPVPPARIVSGKVRFAGRDLLTLAEADLEAVRGRDIAYIFQEPMTSLNPSMPIGRQIGETVALHLGASRAAALDRAAEARSSRAAPASVRAAPAVVAGGWQPARACAVPATVVSDRRAGSRSLECIKHSPRSASTADRHDRHTAVFRCIDTRLVQWFARTLADRRQAFGQDAVLTDQVADHGLGSQQRQLLVVSGVAARVGMAFDVERKAGQRIRLHGAGQRVQRGLGFGSDIGRIGREGDQQAGLAGT
jgi:ABC-type dipeptide/oligopeptide/nickel transport system ATPase subunit